MQLCKDFVEERICYYWCDRAGVQISPRLATLSDAEDWWKTYSFSMYRGQERRKSIYDRRTNHEKRKRIADGAAWGAGRRLTDIPIRVARDLAQQKISILSSETAPRHRDLMML